MTCLEVDDNDIIEFCPESPLSRRSIVSSPPARIVYVCSLCLRQYDILEDLRGHMMVYHKYKPIVNDVDPPQVVKQTVSKQISVLNVSESHVSAVADCASEPRLGPEMLSVPFKDFRILLRARLQLACTFSTNCVYKFKDEMKLRMHEKCHQKNTYSCCECGLAMPNWRRCSAHLWKVHQLDVDLLHCPICTYKSTVSVLVWRHMRVHKKWRSRVLRSLRAVLRRRQQQTLNSKQTISVTQASASRSVCTSASKSASTSVASNKKNKYYSEKTCDICNRVFVNGKTLTKHVKTVHNKIKPFICNVCGKKTARKASLVIHMRQHTGEKPLQCKICKFSTRDPSVLHKHKLRHDKQGKLKCIICTYTCIQANAYKRHIRLNHPMEYCKISCDLCNYSSISEARLNAHKEDHRKGLITNYEDSMDASRAGPFKYPQKLNDKNNEISADCFMPLESIDSLPHEPTLDTGGVTIPAPSEDTQFPAYLNG